MAKKTQIKYSIPPAERHRIIYHPLNKISSYSVMTICIVLCFAFIIGGIILALYEYITLKGAGIMIAVGFGFIAAAEFYLIPLQREMRGKAYSIACDFVHWLYIEAGKSVYDYIAHHPSHDQLKRAFSNPDFMKAFRDWLKKGK